MKNKKTANFPSASEVVSLSRKLSCGQASRPLAKGATSIEKTKHMLCEKFVSYANKEKLTNRALAKKLGVAESLVSKILHYHYDEFSVDRLLEYLGRLFDEVELNIRVA